MTMTSLLYFADPMCSWCYGFAPSLDALHARWPALPVQLVMGGLRAEGTPLDERLKATLEHHWREVSQRSGQAFDFAALDREGFTYTTEPACRALVAVREIDPARALPMLHALQRAFYVQSRDTTDARTLADIAAEQGIAHATFSAAFDSQTMRDATAADFELTYRSGIGGFPTLIARRADGSDEVLSAGWLAPDALLARAAATLSAG